MCTLAIYFRVVPEWPVIVAANRDEFLDRPTSDPTTLCDNPLVVGGKDLRAGGTWLGISENGFLAGLLNRRVDGSPNPDARSRGVLCLDALRRKTAAEAARFAASAGGGDYNPFNLLIASRDDAYVAYNKGSGVELVELRSGLHLLTNLNVNDFECPKISGAHGRFADLGDRKSFRRDPIGNRAGLASILSDHSTQLDPRSGRPNALCLHVEAYGTRSSSMIFLGKSPHQIAHFFAPGPPCATPYTESVVPLRTSRAAVQDAE